MPYATPPAPRIAYDRDGTTGFCSAWNGSVSLVEFDQDGLAALNSERGPQCRLTTSYGLPSGKYPWYGAPADYSYVALIFPSPVRLYGFYAFFVAGYSYQGTTLTEIAVQVEGSTDTTNGVDGTWSIIASNVRCNGGDTSHNSPSVPNITIDGASAGTWYGMTLNDTYRRIFSTDNVGIYPVAGAATRNLRGIRIKPYFTDMTRAAYGDYSTILASLHLYGEPDTGALADRLSFWRPDVDAEMPVGWLDWGDVPLSTTADKSFRIKNLSTTLTANSIAISIPPLATEPSPTIGSMITFSLDGGVTWASTATLAALSPGAVSGEIKMRRTVPNNASLSNWAPRVAVDPASWA